ncbi:MAG: hypothetical protein LBS50_05980 [Prevotellaceae bacterium]|jgi:hypothetical protein|nr:hypothetical protein [Prevotellaceae bacterium]
MLTDNKIINIIREYEHEYAVLQKNSCDFHKIIAKQLLNTDENEKQQVLDFFLREIKFNANELRYTALIIIEEMKAVELCPYIVNIYNEIEDDIDSECKKIIISLLMNLRYLPPQELYKKYVLNYIENNQNSFYLLVQYCNVSPTEALPLLANEFTENILSKENMLNNPRPIGNSLCGIYVLISFLVSYFYKNSINYLLKLLNLVSFKNITAGIYLKNAIVNYFNSDWAKRNYSKLWIDNEIDNLTSPLARICNPCRITDL